MTVAYVQGAAWHCDRCPKTYPTAEGFTRIEVFTNTNDMKPARTLDFCPACRIQVDKTLRALAPRAQAV